MGPARRGDDALAGILLEFDGVTLHGPVVTVSPTSPGVRRRRLPPERSTSVRGLPCTDGLQTLLDLAASLDDLQWGQALESALRLKLATVTELEGALTRARRAHSAARHRATGWLCGRFTWTEVTRFRQHTIRQLAGLTEQARRRPLPID